VAAFLIPPEDEEIEGSEQLVKRSVGIKSEKVRNRTTKE
jgi:hypothetical protein